MIPGALGRVVSPRAPLPSRAPSRAPSRVLRVGAVERQAGSALVVDGDTPGVLPAEAVFDSSGGANSSFWLIAEVTPTGSDRRWILFRGSPSQVLWDIRDTVARIDGSIWPSTYAPELLAAIPAALRAWDPPQEADANVLEHSTPGVGVALSREWLRAMLLVTYGRPGNTLADVQLASRNRMPVVGGADWTPPPAGAVVEVVRGFLPNTLPANPFPNTGGSRIETGGGGGGGGNGSAGLLALGLLALVFAGSGK